MAITIEEHVPLAPYTTLKIGGESRFFVSVTTPEELREAIAEAQAKQWPILILAGGSNLLINDDGWPGLTIHIALTERSYHPTDEVGVVEAIYGAGENWDSVVAEAVSRGLWGMENLSGIPGSVGATPVQNVGAYGVEVADTISFVEVFNTKSFALERLTPAECKFKYRDSFFKTREGSGLIITRVAFTLSESPAPRLTYKDLAEYFSKDVNPTLAGVREAVLHIRAGKFPDTEVVGTAGSFFKNPIITKEQYRDVQKKYPDIPCYPTPGERRKVPLAWILDKVLNLKGVHYGTVHLHEKQPLVVWVEPGTTAKEVTEVAEEIKSQVEAKTGIVIEAEVALVTREQKTFCWL